MKSRAEIVAEKHAQIEGRSKPMTQDNSGPAFPTQAHTTSEMTDNGWEHMRHIPQPGMSLRDHFAGNVLPSLFSGIPGAAQAVVLAETAYMVADAMINERNKK